MITLKKIYYYLFLIGWFFFPFNEFDGIPALGEYKNEAGAFFFFTGFIVLLVDVYFKKRISIPYKSFIFQVLLFFIGWCLITTILNIGIVTESYYKHTGGVYRFIRQYISLLIATIIFVVLYWNVLKDLTSKEILLVLRKVFLASLIIAFCYGLIETLIIVFNMYFLMPVLQLFDYFPFLKGEISSNTLNERISSIAYEAPSLGNYLITIGPWMFSYMATHRSFLKYLPTCFILFLTFFSGSRTALINVTLELIIFFGVLLYSKEHRSMVLNIMKGASLIALLVIALNGPKIIKAFDKKAESLNFAKNLTKNVSNQSRFGMQYASLQVFLENPLVGVGFGQETYHKRYYYPTWATKKNWEFPLYYKNQKDPSFPPGYNIYTRLLAETGIVGAFLFIFMVYLCFYNSIKLWKKSEDEQKTVALILIISFTGLSLNWMQQDFFRQHGYWLSMVLLISLQYRQKLADE